jgi:hypothetical protein
VTRHAPSRQAPDPKKLGRASLLWMLHEAGASFGQIGEAIGFSGEHVRKICHRYGQILGQRAVAMTRDGSQLSARLVQAGAAFPANGPVDDAAHERRIREMNHLLAPRDLHGRAKR